MAKIDELLESIDALSVAELAELVKGIEEKTLLFLFLFSTSRRKAFRWNQCVFTGISDNGIL